MTPDNEALDCGPGEYDRCMEKIIFSATLLKFVEEEEEEEEEEEKLKIVPMNNLVKLEEDNSSIIMVNSISLSSALELFLENVDFPFQAAAALQHIISNPHNNETLEKAIRCLQKQMNLNSKKN
ncbi:MAG: hypothetical protein GY915_01580 [bacterium]|nr:hypothetical protein [bacterium]